MIEIRCGDLGILQHETDAISESSCNRGHRLGIGSPGAWIIGFCRRLRIAALVRWLGPPHGAVLALAQFPAPNDPALLPGDVLQRVWQLRDISDVCVRFSCCWAHRPRLAE